MRLALMIVALAALGACGVDGVPEQPGKRDTLAPARNAPPQNTGDGWIGGTVSMHTGVVL